MSTTIPEAASIYPRPLVEADKITFWWNPPTNPGGSPISSYTLFCTNPSITQSVPQNIRSFCISNLSTSRTYSFSIYPTNSFGDGPSSIFRTVTCGYAPAAPTNVQAFLTPNTISTTLNGIVTWAPSSNDGGSGILGNKLLVDVYDSNYAIVSTLPYSYLPSITSTTVESLSSIYNYITYVQSVNDVNASSKDNYSTIIFGLSSNFTGDSVFTSVRTIDQFSPIMSAPMRMNVMTLQNTSLGWWDYVKKGPTVLSNFNSDEWFTTIEDIRSAWVIVDGDFTIDSGITFTPPVRKLFTVLYVKGNLTVNGSISMTARGANHNKDNVISESFNNTSVYPSYFSANLNGTVGANAIRIATGNYAGVSNVQVPTSGGGGGSGRFANINTYGNFGALGIAGGTGGGGQGSSYFSQHIGGSGATGSSFSGGSAGGGSRFNTTTGGGNSAQGNGGVSGAPSWGGTANGSGYTGVGNPTWPVIRASAISPSGTGGVLIIICDGNVSGSGTIQANGVTFSITETPAGPGGSSGGGSVTIMHGGTCSIVPTANGGNPTLGALWAGPDNVKYFNQTLAGGGGHGTARTIKYNPTSLAVSQYPFYNVSYPDVLSLADSISDLYANSVHSVTLSSTSNLTVRSPGTFLAVPAGTLTINGVSLGNWEYSVRPTTTITSVTSTDYFTPSDDFGSSWIIFNGNLTINSGQTLIPAVRRYFTVVYINGNLINNGSISMTARGANHNGGMYSGGQFTAGPIRIATGTYSGVSNPEIPAAGGAGGAGADTSTNAASAGSAGTGGGTGGGGGGAAELNVTAGGNGSAGTSFSGGSGGGGAGSNASPNGGPGGDTNTLNGTGGAGNLGGTNTTRYILSGAAGTGGVLILIVKGTITGTGNIQANGVANTITNGVNPGGSSGGGSVTVLTAGTSAITPTANGGSAVTGSSGTVGGAGGAGTARVLFFPYNSFFNYSGSSIYDTAEALYAAYSTFNPIESPISLGTLTINSGAVGSWEYYQRGTTIVNTTMVNDFFSSTADTVSSWIVINGDLTIPGSITFIPPARKLFTVLYVSGNLTVNGIISMTARGASHSALVGTAIRIITGTYDGITNPEVPGGGGAGGTGTTTTAPNGSAGTGGGTGGGGAGGLYTGSTRAGGNGTTGTSFSGGVGGGSPSSSANGGTGTFRGGAGGTTPAASGLGGVGNPGGTGGLTQNSGTGGVLFIICKGNISGVGRIEANGVTSVQNTSGFGAGGGSGGGSVTVLCPGQNTIPISASGGIPSYGFGNFLAGGGGYGTARSINIGSNLSIYSSKSAASIYDLAETISSDYQFLNTLTYPVFGGPLTINSVALGNWEYVVKGTTTISSYIPSEWFSYKQDTVSSWIIVRGDLTINNYQILIPPVRKLFTVVYVTGNLSLSTGSISMTARGANHLGYGFNAGGVTAAGDIRLTQTFISGTTTAIIIPAAGGTGGTNASPNGFAGSSGGTGGGGAGSTNASFIRGAGSSGSCFSGGCGGGPAYISTMGTNQIVAGDAFSSGGPGGSTPQYVNTIASIGNPCGSNSTQPSNNGTGGVLILIVRGNITSSGTSPSIQSDGSTTFAGSANGGSVYNTCGGPSGAGSVNVFFGGTNSITPLASGQSAITTAFTASGSSGAGTARALSLSTLAPLYTATGASILAIADSISTTFDTYAYTTTPFTGDNLTVNSVALGKMDFVVKPTTTVSTFTNTDWFTTRADLASAWIFVKGDLTINSGQTFIPSNRKLFTVLYVTGNLTVNGTISMTARGANHSGTGVSGGATTAGAIRIATATYSGVTNPEIPAAGGAGGTGTTSTTGNPGGAGTAGGSGGGGSGGSDFGSVAIAGGSGSAGTSFSGGAGGGGASSTGGTTTGGGTNGGAGGNGGTSGSGGSGNNGGTGATTGGTGTGGILIIICKGTISGSGSIQANGTNGTASTSFGAGGASGGGSVTILFSVANSITPTATGGASANGFSSRTSGAGGAGTARALQIV